MPAQNISRRVVLGKRIVDLRHASPKHLIAPGSAAGTVVQTLRHVLGFTRRRASACARPLPRRRRRGYGASSKMPITPHLISLSDIIPSINSKQRKTLGAIFAKPTQGGIVFTDIESLVRALGGEVLEREGSRVKIVLNGQEWRCHRPHPGKEARKYQVEEARELFERAGVKP